MGAQQHSAVRWANEHWEGPSPGLRRVPLEPIKEDLQDKRGAELKRRDFQARASEEV